VGGGLGGMFGAWWILTGNIMYIAFIVTTIVVVFFATWAAMVKLTRFELQSTP
jgi:hypothetical protein